MTKRDGTLSQATRIERLWGRVYSWILLEIPLKKPIRRPKIKK
jgi:hypothetical protein